MLKQSPGLHLSQLDDSRQLQRERHNNEPSPFNQDTLLSFEKELHHADDCNLDFAATGEFKGLNSESPADGPYCQLGSGQTLFGGKADDHEREILGDETTSCFYNEDKSGISMVEAIQQHSAKRKNDE